MANRVFETDYRYWISNIKDRSFGFDLEEHAKAVFDK